MMGRPAKVKRRTRSPWPARIGISVYVMVLMVVPPLARDSDLRWYWLWLRNRIDEQLLELLRAVGVLNPSAFLKAEVYYLLTALVVPMTVCLLVGRFRLADNGWRKPNVLLLRILVVSFLVSIPFLIWMVQGTDFLRYYQPYVKAGPLRLVIYYAVMLFCEHSFFEGVMLAAFRSGGRWPEAITIKPTTGRGWRKVAQWFGVAQDTGKSRGLSRVVRWLGIPDGCIGAILLSGTLFGLIHCGKAGREFFLAFPGGMFLGFLAYRCNSWHAPYLLHAGTFCAAATLYYLLAM